MRPLTAACLILGALFFLGCGAKYGVPLLILAAVSHTLHRGPAAK